MAKKSPLDWKPGAEKKLKEFLGKLSPEDMWSVVEYAGTLHITDAPSSSDVARIFDDYLKGSTDFRDGVDAAFRWWTGYNFDAVVARTVHGQAWEDIVAKWRPGP